MKVPWAPRPPRNWPTSSRDCALYSTGKVVIDGQTLTLDDLDDRLRTERDPAKTKAMWEAWHAVAKPMAAERLAD